MSKHLSAQLNAQVTRELNKAILGQMKGNPNMQNTMLQALCAQHKFDSIRLEEVSVKGESAPVFTARFQRGKRNISRSTVVVPFYEEVSSWLRSQAIDAAAAMDKEEKAERAAEDARFCAEIRKQFPGSRPLDIDLAEMICVVKTATAYVDHGTNERWIELENAVKAVNAPHKS